MFEVSVYLNIENMLGLWYIKAVEHGGHYCEHFEMKRLSSMKKSLHLFISLSTRRML